MLEADIVRRTALLSEFLMPQLIAYAVSSYPDLWWRALTLNLLPLGAPSLIEYWRLQSPGECLGDRLRILVKGSLCLCHAR